jgi:hypothetical protein
MRTNLMTAVGVPDGAAVAIAPYSIPVGKQFERFGGPSRSTQYELIKNGEIVSFLVGTRRYIVVQSWLDYVERQRGKDAAWRAAGRSQPMRGAAS